MRAPARTISPPRAAGAGVPAGRKLGWLPPAVVAGGLIPLVVLGLRAGAGALGPDPVAEALNQLGLLALVLLVASLAATPLKLVSGWTFPLRIRKALGLLAFFYACAHFLTYAIVDQGLDVRAIVEDITERPFLLAGFVALLVLVPLAATSTARMLKRLGAARWKRLHRLAYAAAVLGIVHFFLRVKKDATEPMIYAALLALLFAVRIASAVLHRRAAPR
ncbi:MULTISPECIES: sulfite oxidase heme-binding subunit YedZ [Sorangium]|uniref:Protein-methionine-sulfoxide reductase heme-binding subunit MsrQ n=1 Tax=Sorangium cellulosum (strain So ce56) TaxID=448385 RepID=A9GPA9_SORC5|nr:protein-methionine-sulfoxide reductase heme-binding subunit MsrQ [Sorangium cellulosum]CAN96727.1 putative membrane protein [Sorangium cellulosum So ce56]